MLDTTQESSSQSSDEADAAEGQAAVAASQQAEAAQHKQSQKQSQPQPQQVEPTLTDQDIKDAQAVVNGDISLQEVISKKDGLKEDYKKAVKKEIIQKKK